MEEVLCMRYELNELGIMKYMMLSLLIVLILELVFIMSRKLHLFNQEKTYISKLQQYKNNNNQTASAASVSKVRQ